MNVILLCLPRCCSELQRPALAWGAILAHDAMCAPLASPSRSPQPERAAEMGKTLKRQRQRAKALQAQQPKRLKLEKGSRMAAAVSVALEQGRWADAIKGLEGMAQAGKQPKLGAIMRWVRQADQAGDEQVAAPLLDAIMRAAAAAGPTGAPSADGAAAAAAPATAAARPAATATNGTHAAAVAAAAQAKASRGVERHAPLEVCPLGHIHGQPEYREQPPAQPAASAAAAATAAAGQASTACRAAEGDEEPSTSTQQAAGGAAAAMPVGTSNASGDGEGAAAPALRTSAHPASSCPHPPLSGALQPEHYVSLFYELPFAGEGMRGGPNAIYAFTPGTIHYEATHPSPTRLEVPFVPGAFVLRGAFSRSECAQILAASQALGYRHDVDYTFAAGSSTAGGGGGEGGGQEGRSAAGAAASSSGDGGGGAAPAAVGAPSVAAGSHSDSSGAAAAGAPSAARGVAASLAGAAAGGPAAGCVWYADDSLLGPLYERVRSLLPQELGGGALAGINARWRLYRYSPGAVYRPHVDGAWWVGCSGAGWARRDWAAFQAGEQVRC